MTREEIFEAWAPAGAIWSQWMKPVLFAQMGRSFTQASVAIPPPPPGFQPTALGGGVPASSIAGQPAPSSFGISPPTSLASVTLPDWRTRDASWAQQANDTAMVIDLPGVDALTVGLALTQRGFRPVPMFNACQGPNAACDLSAVLLGLEQWAADVRAASLPPEAPPAFLLDSERLIPKRPLTPGTFDNRWVVFPQDFPSANFLLSRGIRRVILVGSAQPLQDLAHVLLRWQEAGIAIEAFVAGSPSPEPIVVKKPSSFRSLWARFLVAMGLKRSSAGGFGAAIPVQSSGGGYH